jgi:hypothetical protein
MTVPERLDARPATFHPSRHRAPARNAEVHPNSDNHSDDAVGKYKTSPHFAPEPVPLSEPSLPYLAAACSPSATH